MATRAVPAPLAQLPNALTILRLVLIPVFVVLAVDAGGNSSWPAGLVFGIAGISKLWVIKIGALSTASVVFAVAVVVLATS